MVSKILALKARQILDSRGNPTVEVDLKTSTGIYRASVPSGASTGVHEAVELRDKKKAFLGKGVLQAVRNVNTVIARKLKGMTVDQQKIDTTLITLDGTENKAKLGANALLAVSMAAARAGAEDKPLYSYLAQLAKTKKIVLPIPSFNIINGGKHAGNNLDMQEYMIFPLKAKSFSDALQIGAETYHHLKTLLEKRYGKNATNVGDEGGFAPPLSCYHEPLDLIMEAADNAGHRSKVKIAIDAAATTFFRSGRYLLEGDRLSASQLMERYENMVKNYHVVSIEDPFHEEAFDSFAELTKRIGKKIQIVGDDLLVTNPELIKKAVSQQACNALLLKINQIGTITEALEAAQLARKAGWKIMASHRSGETTDDFIADLAVGLGTGQIKAGAPCRGERLAKYIQLLRIEEALGRRAVYGGRLW